MGVGVPVDAQLFVHINLCTQFFADLALQAGDQVFIRLQLASGELPQTSQQPMIGRWAISTAVRAGSQPQ